MEGRLRRRVVPLTSERGRGAKKDRTGQSGSSATCHKSFHHQFVNLLLSFGVSQLATVSSRTRTCHTLQSTSTSLYLLLKIINQY